MTARSFAPDARENRRPVDRQLAELLNALDDAVADLRLGWRDRDRESDTYNQRVGQTAFDLMARAKQRMRDGYPSSSGLEANGGRAASTCEHCHGTGTRIDTGDECHCDPGAPIHGDPVGELVTAGDTVDEIRRARDDLLRGVRSAASGLGLAVDALRSAEPPSGSLRPDGCKSHARIGRWEPITRNGRCRWCDDVLRLEGVEPPLSIIEAHDRGDKISVQRMAAAIIEEYGPQPRRKRKKGRGRP